MRGDAMNRFLTYSYGMLAVAWLVLTLCFATTVFAQTDTGSVRGTVTDEQGRAVPQAQVTIANADTAYSRSVKSDADGNYVFQSIPAGRYTLRVAGTQGFQGFSGKKIFFPPHPKISGAPQIKKRATKQTHPTQ